MQFRLHPTLDMSFPVRKQSYLGRARSEAGLVLNGIFHRKFNRTEHTLVYTNGHLHRRYIYPLIEHRFSSPLVNDHNLCFVGAWFAVDHNGIAVDTYADLLQRVAAGLKPMGWTNAFKCYPDKVSDLIQLETHARAAGLATSLTEQDDRLQLSFCQKGKVRKLFELDLLQKDYVEMVLKAKVGCEYKDFFAETIEELRNRYLEDFIDWNLQEEDFADYFLKTGLFLGFPPETTFALLTEHLRY